MLETLLIANRGEIACRVIRTARRLGIKTVAVYSDADRQALHVQAADEAVHIGGAAALDSYLNIARVIEAAQSSGAQAIHPGYGFLSENAEFAQACQDAGMIFVGPSAEAIRTMGSKMASKRLMQTASVPVLPGYHGDDQSPERLLAEAHDVGFPLLIKASAGGGGKGMRLVEDAAQFEDQLAGARREAAAAFGDDAVLLERYLIAPKHIEVQLMADTHGQVVYLFERDCSVQRRHQKVIEEAPAPIVDAQLRQRLGEAAVRVAQRVGYVGAGTVEFIAEQDEFYFMEMNTRLQVEHPITEAITGVDLVEWQLRVASGEHLPLSQSELTIQGHAVELRLYAENPGKRFLPSTGKLEQFQLPAGLRVDTGVGPGDEVSMHYDPMLAKLIAHGETRQAAIDRLVLALGQARIAGVEHNLGYLRRLLQTPEFIGGDYTTGIAEQVHDQVAPSQSQRFAALAGLFLLSGGGSSEAQPWDISDGFRQHLSKPRSIRLKQGKRVFCVSLETRQVAVDGERYAFTQWSVDQDQLTFVEHAAAITAYLHRSGTTCYVMCEGHTERFVDLTDDVSQYGKSGSASGGVLAPMPGQVIAINAKPGDQVKVGDVLVVVEAMKMEHSVLAPQSGTVQELLCEVGGRVDDGTQLLIIE